jgi:hypothetical protein
MARTNLVDTDRELRIGDQVQDGRADAEVVDKRKGEVQIEYYSDGKTIWLQRNVFQYDDDRGWRTV